MATRKSHICVWLTPLKGEKIQNLFHTLWAKEIHYKKDWVFYVISGNFG